MINVLLIEDNDRDREIFRRKISTHGRVKVHTVKNFLEGVNAVLERKYDLIMTDLNLPGLTGREAVEKFEAMTHNQIPVMAVCDTELKEDPEHSCVGDQTLPDIFKNIEASH